MSKLLLVIAVLGIFSAVMTGCKASAEVGDTQTSIAQPR